MMCRNHQPRKFAATYFDGAECGNRRIRRASSLRPLELQSLHGRQMRGESAVSRRIEGEGGAFSEVTEAPRAGLESRAYGDVCDVGALRPQA